MIVFILKLDECNYIDLRGKVVFFLFLILLNQEEETAIEIEI